MLMSFLSPNPGSTAGYVWVLLFTDRREVVVSHCLEHVLLIQRLVLFDETVNQRSASR